MKSLLTSSPLFISIQFNDIINNQSLVRRAPDQSTGSWLMLSPAYNIILYIDDFWHYRRIYSFPPAALGLSTPSPQHPADNEEHNLQPQQSKP